MHGCIQPNLISKLKAEAIMKLLNVVMWKVILATGLTNDEMDG